MQILLDIILFVLSSYFNINSEQWIYTLRGTRPRRILIVKGVFRMFVRLGLIMN